MKIDELRGYCGFTSFFRAVFLYGFAKNEQDNISKSELKMFKKLGNDLLIFSENDLERALQNGVLYSLEESK